MEDLEGMNAELLERLCRCCALACGVSSCCPEFHKDEGCGCVEAKDGGCDIWETIKKAKGA